jgi:hypothetical protein
MGYDVWDGNRCDNIHRCHRCNNDRCFQRNGVYRCSNFYRCSNSYWRNSNFYRRNGNFYRRNSNFYRRSNFYGCNNVWDGDRSDDAWDNDPGSSFQWGDE